MSNLNTQTIQKSNAKSSSKTGLCCDEIAKLAYELYLKRGGVDGGDVEDWLKAERILKAQ